MQFVPHKRAAGAAALLRYRLRAGPREDDTEEALQHRLRVYEEQTAPVAEFYASKGILKTLDGMQEMDEVTQQINAVLKEI